MDSERMRSFLDRRTAVAVLASTDARGQPEVCLLVAPRLMSDGRVAAGEEDRVGGRTFRNLRQNPQASIVVLDPIMDPRARDGVRLDVEFLGAEEDGDELDHLTGWLSAFAPGRRVVRRLLFKVLDAHPYRPVPDEPVIHA